MLLRYLILSLVIFWTRCAFAHDLENLTILSYHEIADKKDSLVPEYAVTPTNFVRQIDWLRNNGYHFISVDQYLAARKGQETLPSKAVLLTFDDGYADTYSIVYPV
ncbi:MAG TPA: poly-beta-1,6-N-acetyl-D-glucosamine N-deacetylase PgaB, partial [Agitococcus sp.]|nr:poly-beta-1,6-N-acetyl-D-glucosamine N-deacetylase PgaB [Agitococcus sp.]